MTERETRKLKPAEGRRVRLPGTGLPLPEKGVDLELDSFVRRRLLDGDLVDATKPAKKD